MKAYTDISQPMATAALPTATSFVQAPAVPNLCVTALENFGMLFLQILRQ